MSSSAPIIGALLGSLCSIGLFQLGLSLESYVYRRINKIHLAVAHYSDKYIMLAIRNHQWTEIKTIRHENLDQLKKINPNADIITSWDHIHIHDIPSYKQFHSAAIKAGTKTVITYRHIGTFQTKMMELPWAECKQELR